MKGLLAIILLLAIVAGGFVWYKSNTPFAGFSTAVRLEIPRGTSAAEIGRRLAAAGVVERPEWFLAAHLLRGRRRLQAGEYAFERPDSAFGVLDRLARGDVFYYQLIVPEGANVFDVARLVEELGFGRADTFRKMAIRSEGRLFPAVCRLTKGPAPEDIVRKMTARHEQAWRELAADDKQRNDLVTLASLVEKEARVPEERPLIAAVYHNRLKQGMKLDCDPTVIYAALLEGKYRGTIYRSDLDREHPYNTYRVAGLPPGPIANPGMESLRAALHPADVDYLFFVARPDGSGRHIFSRTMAEHSRAVAEYRRGEKTEQKTDAAGRSGAAGAGRHR